jgi:hypothetical protein
MGHVGESGWEVRVEERTAVVELHRQLSLDDRASQRLYDAISTAVSGDVDRVVTLVEVEHPLSAGLHDVVRKGARTAAENGVTDWLVVAEHDSKGVAFEREITGLDTAVVDDEDEARQRFA